MRVRQFVVTHLDHTDNETSMKISAIRFEVHDSGDLVFYSIDSLPITAFARGRWLRAAQLEVD